MVFVRFFWGVGGGEQNTNSGVTAPKSSEATCLFEEHDRSTLCRS